MKSQGKITLTSYIHRTSITILVTVFWNAGCQRYKAQKTEKRITNATTRRRETAPAAGQACTVGGYNPDAGEWEILDSNGPTASLYYTFKTDGNTVQSGCFYYSPKYVNLSKCYPLAGSKTKSTTKPLDSFQDANDEKARENEAQFDTIPSNSIVERYNQLKALLPNN